MQASKVKEGMLIDKHQPSIYEIGIIKIGKKESCSKWQLPKLNTLMLKTTYFIYFHSVSLEKLKW